MNFKKIADASFKDVANLCFKKFSFAKRQFWHFWVMTRQSQCEGIPEMRNY